MKWSKLKQKVEERFANSVRGKVHIYSTRYSSNGNRCKCGRAWLTYNGKQIANFETILNLGRTHRLHEPITACGHITIAENMRDVDRLVERGEFSRFHLHEACWELLQIPLVTAIGSTNPLIQGLAFLDGRLGKRRLESLKDIDLHPFPRALLEIRLAEYNPPVCER
ncbi:MAG: hypothetical protein U0103_02215 [Candidatus Obscuribacterales bacterium]